MAFDLHPGTGNDPSLEDSLQILHDAIGNNTFFITLPNGENVFVLPTSFQTDNDVGTAQPGKYDF